MTYKVGLKRKKEEQGVSRTLCVLALGTPEDNDIGRRGQTGTEVNRDETSRGHPQTSPRESS